MAVPVRMIAARRGRFVLSRMHGELRSVAVFGLPPALPSVVAVIVDDFLPGVRVAVHRSPTRFGGERRTPAPNMARLHWRRRSHTKMQKLGSQIDDPM